MKITKIKNLNKILKNKKKNSKRNLFICFLTGVGLPLYFFSIFRTVSLSKNILLIKLLRKIFFKNDSSSKILFFNKIMNYFVKNERSVFFRIIKVFFYYYFQVLFLQNYIAQ